MNINHHKSSYFHNLITLIAGTGIAQTILIIISPILTRLYSPEHFGVFALYMAMSSITAVLVTGRYEMAIVMPKSDRDAFHIVILCILLSCIVSIFLLMVFTLLGNQIAQQLVRDPKLTGWLYWIPLSTLLIGVYSSINYWNNRRSQYRRLAISRIFQNGGISIAQLAFGYATFGIWGLIVGQLIGQLVATLLLMRLIYINDLYLLNSISIKRIFILAKKHINFPKYMIAGQLMNVASGYLPVFLLSVFFGPTVAGFYSLSQRVLIAPSILIGSAIGDVYRSEVSKVYRKTGNCITLFKKTLIKLVIVSLFFSIPFFFFGEKFFALVFGQKWGEAGEIASLISIMIFFQTISSPLSQTVLLANKQGLDLAWQVLRFLLAAISLFLGYTLFSNYKVALFLFALAFSFLYLLHTFFQYAVARGWR